VFGCFCRRTTKAQCCHPLPRNTHGSLIRRTFVILKVLIDNHKKVRYTLLTHPTRANINVDVNFEEGLGKG
jgi:hypothetical protein